MSAAGIEHAVILACWDNDDPLLAGIPGGAALVDVAGKPLAQRSVERAVALGASRIDLVLGEHARGYEVLLGSGERWGCAIVYHYASPGSGPLRSIARRLSREADCLLLHADSSLSGACAPTPQTIGCSVEGDEKAWDGWARASGSVLHDCAGNAVSRADLGRALMADARLRHVVADPSPSAATAAGLLSAVRGLLHEPDYPIGIARHPASAGVWIGNGTRVHPTARLIAPVYLGDHVLVGPAAVVGPHAVIGERSVIDAGATVADALAAPGSYVGRGVELQHAILAGRRLVNVELGVALEVPDRELAGTVATDARAQAPGLAERCLAIALWIAGWSLRRPRRSGSANPVSAVDAIYTGAPGAWRRHFREVFHPGLPAVARGRMRLVGPSGRSPAATAGSAEPSHEPVARARPGLVNEALVLGVDGADPAIRYAADVLSAKKLHIVHIVRIVLRYARAVTADRRQSGGDRSPTPGTPLPSVRR